VEKMLKAFLRGGKIIKGKANYNGEVEIV